MDEILTVKQVAAEYKLSRAQAYREVGKMPHIRLGRSVRVRRSVVEAYMKEKTVLPRA